MKRRKDGHVYGRNLKQRKPGREAGESVETQNCLIRGLALSRGLTEFLVPSHRRFLLQSARASGFVGSALQHCHSILIYLISRLFLFRPQPSHPLVVRLFKALPRLHCLLTAQFRKFAPLD